ncbi:hypothetical protein C8R45DRAFT_942335 [Mycena sanguinolenta]|nr:hypothetical protein C8R45DRAFT_942335 [Mycena sanguinolenta]
MKIHPMEALRDIPGFFLDLALGLLLDCILSAREAPTGPHVRTSVRDKSVRDKHSQAKIQNQKTNQKEWGVNKGNANGAGSAMWAGREVACAIMLVPQEQGPGRVNGGRAQVAERLERIQIYLDTDTKAWPLGNQFCGPIPPATLLVPPFDQRIMLAHGDESAWHAPERRYQLQL